MNLRKSLSLLYTDYPRMFYILLAIKAAFAFFFFLINAIISCCHTSYFNFGQIGEMFYCVILSSVCFLACCYTSLPPVARLFPFLLFATGEFSTCMGMFMILCIRDQYFYSPFVGNNFAVFFLFVVTSLIFKAFHLRVTLKVLEIETTITEEKEEEEEKGRREGRIFA